MLVTPVADPLLRRKARTLGHSFILGVAPILVASDHPVSILLPGSLFEPLLPLFERDGFGGPFLR